MTDHTGDVETLLSLARWDWVYTVHGERLHALESAEPLEGYDACVAGYGRTACGLKTFVSIPGLLSRMSLPRCKRCCRRTGMPEGRGSPKNDKECRAMLEKEAPA